MIPPDQRVYLQHLGLWAACRDEVKAFLQPSPYACIEAARLWQDMPPSPIVSVHVRRGDFEHLGRLLPLEYYEQAVSYVRVIAPSASVAVFSDDIRWARRHSIFKDAVFVEGLPDWADLTLMTMCDHHVCANSTFSWWGAFLSDDASPIVPWIEGVLPDLFRHTIEGWREIVIVRD